MEVLAVYDTTEQIESRTTPDLLAQLLFAYLPQSEAWISVPEEDDPTGENWTPQWTDISVALAEIERFLKSEPAHQMEIPDFTTDELIGELHLFRDELKRASAHTSRFHLSIC
ncbi:hypothetical protein SDC9_154693 [bioreactor metagenome]|uniref:Uncharacterized protein n=1 Tax=bioreactor metagenome TaxID=1076179 RepID=A0A645F4D3_9ZZZZ